MNSSETGLLSEGTVIPAHPLVLNEGLKLDERRQRRLTRYYISSGVGGVAVGVHTTQFSIRKQETKLLETVLCLAAEEVEKAKLSKPFIKIAGICGPIEQAVEEARLALKYGYHLGLVSLGALQNNSEDELVNHIKIISEIIPVMGFYLQPAGGGRILSYGFWEKMVELPGVHAIKIAPFNRYQTLDVVRAVCSSTRCEKIAIYTGNDDNIIPDLLTTYRFSVDGKIVEKKIVGGLLGHWAVWTHAAVKVFKKVKLCVKNNYIGVEELLTLGISVTDMNAAIFDSSNSYKGSIAGIHEVLRRQGLIKGIWCLDEEEVLSPGQSEEIDRVVNEYPSLIDDDFVKEFILSDQSN